MKKLMAITLVLMVAVLLVPAAFALPAANSHAGSHIDTASERIADTPAADVEIGEKPEDLPSGSPIDPESDVPLASADTRPADGEAVSAAARALRG